SSDRLGTVAAAFTKDGELTGLRFRNTANMGAYVRPPEPASLYRMHAASNGCYRVKNISVDNELVVTNSTPVGLNRGYGGPQFYFALERIMEIAARGLDIDPAELRRRNFVPTGAFPYKAPAGAVFGQGHATVAAQIVADTLGLHPDDIHVVTEMDTLTSPWSIASGNYSNRFAAIVVEAVAKCAEQVAQKIRLLAAAALDATADEIELHEGYARVRGQSNRGSPFRKAASRAHWDPAGLPDAIAPGLHECAIISPPVLDPPDDEDRIASAVTFGFVIDLAAVEIDRNTGAIRIDKYASVHDVGTQLNPKIVEGQVHGGFAHGLDAALFEDLAYDDQGNFLTGTFADYVCPP